MKHTYVLAMLLVASGAHAASTATGTAPGTATLSWPTATLHTDGSPITGAVTYCAYKGLQGQPKAQLVCGLTGNGYIDAGPLGVGTWCYDLVAMEAGNPNPSGHGTEGCKTIIPAAPAAPPTTVAKAPVYQPTPQINGYKMVQVGTIPPNTRAIAGQYVNGLCVVNRNQVKWSGAARPQVVVAQCGVGA